MLRNRQIRSICHKENWKVYYLFREKYNFVLKKEKRKHGKTEIKRKKIKQMKEHYIPIER